MINIRFQKKNVGGDIANGVFIFLGLIMICLIFTTHEAFILPGVVFTAMGIYPFTISKGVLVDIERKIMYSYSALLWIKFKNKIPMKNYESIRVSTKTRIQGGGGNNRKRDGFMVYELHLIPNPHLKIYKVLLGDFYTKKECMRAAEELSKISSLPIVLKIRQ